MPSCPPGGHRDISCTKPSTASYLATEKFPAQIRFSQSSVSVSGKEAPGSEVCREMVLFSQTSGSTLGSYWEPEIRAGEKGLIHPRDPLQAPGATELGFPDPKLVSLVAPGGFFFLEFLELVPDPVSAFHLSLQFPVASALLSSWGGQMASRVGSSQMWLLAAGTASLQVRDEGLGASPWGRGPQGSV